MALLVFHIDDSKIAGNFFEKRIHEVLPDVTVMNYNNAEDFFKQFQHEALNIHYNSTIIFADYNMPQIDGLHVLNWIKRHPKFHHTPVVITSAAGEAHVIEEVEIKGAFDFISKPISSENLKQIIDKLPRYNAETEVLRQIESSFPEEVQETLENIEMILENKSLDDNDYNHIYRALHTIKGNARSIHYPVFAEFIHRSEDFLSAVKGLGVLNSQKARATLDNILKYLNEQVSNIISTQHMNFAPEKLEKDMLHFKELYTTQDNPSQNFTSNNVISANKNLRQAHYGLRISTKQYEEVQTKFQSILEKHNEIEKKLKDRIKKVKKKKFLSILEKDFVSLKNEVLNTLNHLSSLKAVPINRLQNHASMHVTNLNKELHKEVSLEFIIDNSLYIDKNISEVIEQCFTHIINNCIDHGIEPKANRQQLNKSIMGKIKISINYKDENNLHLIIQDDGQGLNIEKIRDKAFKKKIINKQQFDTLNEQEISNLIFLDDLSTKDEATIVSGRGVGMSYVKQLIDSINGTIYVESIWNKGTIFSITLPKHIAS